MTYMLAVNGAVTAGKDLNILVVCGEEEKLRSLSGGEMEVRKSL